MSEQRKPTRVHQFQKSKTIGLGDVVAAAAKPIAIASDKFFKTNFQNCKDCEEEKNKLNEKIPNIFKPFF